MLASRTRRLGLPRHQPRVPQEGQGPEAERADSRVVFWGTLGYSRIVSSFRPDSRQYISTKLSISSLNQRSTTMPRWARISSSVNGALALGCMLRGRSADRESRQERREAHHKPGGEDIGSPQPGRDRETPRSEP